MLKRNLFTVSIFLMALMCVEGRAQNNPNLVITSAVLNGSTIQIQGLGFRKPHASAPSVYLGSGPNGTFQYLGANSDATDGAIVAQVPANLAAGAYRLIVNPNDGNKIDSDPGDATKGNYAMADITVGLAGPVGPTGAQGITGPQGLQGPVGNPGPQGPLGPIGLTGANGPQGPIGPVGATGATGAPGVQGATGAVGAQGAQGPVGPTGAQGVQGPIGVQGPQGATGPAGPTGATGAVGPVTPGFATAIISQISPINFGDPMVVQLVTVNTYPYSMDLVSVTMPNGGPAPTAYGENVNSRLCPNPSSVAPGGLECRQVFQMVWPYSTCQFNGTAPQLTLTYPTPGVAPQLVTLTLNSENWCNEFAASGSPDDLQTPVIGAVTPTSAARGQAFELDIFGSNLNIGAANQIQVYVNQYWFTPANPTSGKLVVVVPGDLTGNLVGPLNVKVQNGGGASNTVFIPLHP